jgi:hypothetical protein
MQRAAQSRKWLFVLLRGSLFWGGLTALSITLFDWYTAHRLDSTYEIAARFVIFMGLGVGFGLYMWKQREAQGHRKPTRGGNALRLTLFVSLMLGLAYVLWRLVRH